MPSAKAEKRLETALRAMTSPNWGRPLNACVKDLSRYLSGWTAHFRLCAEDALKGFGMIDAHIRRRLRAIIIHQKKRRRFLLRHLRVKGVTPRAAAGAAYHPKGRWFRSNRPGMTQPIRRPGFRPE